MFKWIWIALFSWFLSQNVFGQMDYKAVYGTEMDIHRWRDGNKSYYVTDSHTGERSLFLFVEGEDSWQLATTKMAMWHPRNHFVDTFDEVIDHPNAIIIAEDTGEALDLGTLVDRDANFLKHGLLYGRTESGVFLEWDQYSIYLETRGSEYFAPENCLEPSFCATSFLTTMTNCPPPIAMPTECGGCVPWGQSPPTYTCEPLAWEQTPTEYIYAFQVTPVGSIGKYCATWEALALACAVKMTCEVPQEPFTGICNPPDPLCNPTPMGAVIEYKSGIYGRNGPVIYCNGTYVEIP